jgi:hypothetical protein
LNGMERPAIEDDSSVSEIHESLIPYPSTTGHVRSGGNPPEPSGKAKYQSVTDTYNPLSRP